MASYTYGSLTVPVTADTRKMKGDISGAATASGTEAAGKITTSLSGGLRAAAGFTASIGKAAGTALGGAAIAAAGFGVQAFKAAARVGEMDASLRALAKANNLSYSAMQNTVSSIRKQGIEAGVAQGLVAEFARNQLDLGKATDLATVAQDAAVISGRNSTEVLDDLVHGIMTQNTQVLRNAGINVQAGKAIDAYAKSIGKSTRELTESERATAVLNAVLNQGKSVAGAYAAAMTEPGKVLRSFPRVIDDIKISVGQGLVKALGPAIIGTYDLAKALSAAVAPGGALEPIFEAIGVAVAKLIAPVNTMITSWSKWIENLRPEQVQRITDVIKQFGPALIAAGGGLAVLTGGSVLGKIPVLGGLLSNLMGPVQMVTSGIGKLAGSALAAVPGLGSMGSAAGLLPAAMNPVGAIIAGIVAAIGVLLIASKDFREGVISLGKALWTGLSPALSSVWESLKILGKSLWTIIQAVGDALGPALKNLSPLLEQIGKLFGANVAGGAEGAGSAMTALVPLIVGVIKVIGFLLDITTKVLVPLIEIPLKLAVLAQQAINVANPLRMLGKAVEWLTGVVKTLWHWITGNSPGLIPAFGLLSGAARAAAGVLTGPVAAGFSKLVGVVKSTHAAISGAVSGTWKQVSSVISSTMTQIQGAVSSGFSSMASMARSAGSSMIDGLKGGLSGAKSLGGWIGSNVTGPVTGAMKSGFGIKSPSTITITFGEELVNGLMKGLELAKKAGGWVKVNVAGPIIGALKGAFKIGSPSKVMVGIGENLGDSLLMGWSDSLHGESLVPPGVGSPHMPSPLVGAAPGLAGLGASSGATINVYPQQGQSETEIAAAVSRRLGWAVAAGRV